MDFSTSILHGIIICIPFSVFVLVSFFWRPRLWLHSLPKDIAGMVPPKTSRENKLTRYVLLPIYILILPGLSIASSVYLHVRDFFKASLMSALFVIPAAVILATIL